MDDLPQRLPRRRRRRGGAAALLAVAAVVATAVGTLQASHHASAGPSPSSTTAPSGAGTAASPLARPVPTSSRPTFPNDPPTVAGVTAALQRRASAVLRRDVPGFMAGVDPERPTVAARERATIRALSAVPFSRWSYRIEGSLSFPQAVELGGTIGLVAHVRLAYRIRGYDVEDSVREQWLVFVERGGRWVVVSDADGPGRVTVAADPWDVGPVAVAKGRYVVVLGPPGDPALASWASAGDQAVTSVSDVWGTRWPRRAVIVVPPSVRVGARLLQSSTGYFSKVAAVTAGRIDPPGQQPTSVRIVINPSQMARAGDLGRRLVLTHEMTHVATHGYSEQGMPLWLVEGFADYVGFDALHLPVSVSESDVVSRARAGRLPAALPTDAAFDPSQKDAELAYEEGDAACRAVAGRYGRAAVVALYRAVGSARSGDRAAALAAGVRTVLHEDVRAFVAQWRSYERGLA